MRKLAPCLLILFFLSLNAALYSQQRFPKPEFESGYVYPEQQKPAPRNIAWGYIDVAILVAALFMTARFAIKKHSRKGIILMSVFSLVYFGFFREGCICSVGSIQNVSLALFNDGYAIPVTALLFFIIPLLFALAYGRVFCAGVCPLGAVQELTGLKPVRLPEGIERLLATIPFIYLALAVVFSATNSRFIICRYDPFVGFFRLNAPYTMVIFGVLLLIAGIFLNRPYCRYLCPYGVLLNLFSRFAVRHVSITPAECTNCRLCEDSCPYGAIIPSNEFQKKEPAGTSRKRFLTYMVLIPFFALGGAYVTYSLSSPLAGINNNVRLAREIRAENDKNIPAISQAAKTFKESGQTEEQLFITELNIVERFKKASPWAGLFLGLSLGIGLVSLTMRTERTEYKPHQGKCLSCGRCFAFCPVDPKNKK
jgi:polyferredoxin